ncbi:type II toxin-antitoxin system HicB family antitoxin, partial [Acinetobacter baumannii]|nr:type II toxin-antitoxin system HicB family antitoxin [Acinetobacter baumannii]
MGDMFMPRAWSVEMLYPIAI